MRRGIQIALAILMIISAMSLAFVGCGGGDEGPTGNETIKIKAGRTYPLLPGYWGAPAANDSAYKWEEAVETVTEGRIDIEFYPSETLFKENLAFDAIDAGIAQIGWTIPSYQPEWIPLELVFYLPLDIDSLEMNYQVHWYAYDKYFLPQYEERGMISVSANGREKYVVFSPYKRIDTIEDFQGTTIMTSGKSMEQLVSKLGALSITLPWNDCYEALSKGTLDCSALDITLPILFGWHEVGDPGYIVKVGGIGNAMPVWVAKDDLLTRLRPEDAYALIKLTDYWFGSRAAKGNDALNLLFWDEAINLGMEIIDWPESEKEKLRVMKREVYDWWVDWMEAEYGCGEQAALLLDDVLQWMEDFEPGNPIAMSDEAYPVELQGKLINAGYVIDEEAWQEVIGPDGHWGMDYVYKDDWEPWYEKWWDEQNMEHPWYSAWKERHGK